MSGLLSRLARPRQRLVVVECRHCGTTIDGSPPACPNCGETGFAEYCIRP